MKSKGFGRKRYVFHRLVNNKIVQKLSYCMFSGRQEFTIQFGFEPLCSGEEIDVFMDDYRLGSLMGNKSLGYMGTDNPDALRESLELCQQYIFPYFDWVVDYESFYDYGVNNHKIMLGKLSDAYIKAHSELLKAPIDNAFFQVSLATGHYDMAQKSREGLLYQNENAASKKKSTLSSPWQDKIQILRAEYTSLKNAMDRNDRTFIEEYVHANEKQALESYIRNFYGKRAFDSYQKSGKLPFAFTE